MSDYQVDREKWSKMNILEQMGNIGSEVGRSIAAKEAGKEKRFEGAFKRALDLFQATVDVQVAKKSPRSKEVLRAKDQYIRLFYDDTFAEDAEKLENYFMQYAIAARRGRGQFL
jgi:hypothetical protein